MYVVIIHYKKPLSEVEKVAAAHRTYLDIGYERNYLVASGPQNPRVGGILISQLSDKAVLEAFLSQDPFILQDVADYEYIEFTPIKYHPDFRPFLG